MIEVTLDTLVDNLRAESEILFGKPMNDWQYLGVEFRDDGPSLLYYPESGNITICLSNHVKTDGRQLIFQLSHEVCHLLYPSKTLTENSTIRPTVLNEGISTYFQIKKMEDFFELGQATIDSLKVLNPNYFEAYILVNTLIAQDPESIKKLRNQKPRINEIEPNDFNVLNFEISDQIKNRLVAIF
jgi:hypothetical protein